VAALVVPVPTGRPTFLASPRVDTLDDLDVEIAIIGVPYTVPYGMEGLRQYSSTAPAAIRKQSLRFVDFLSHYDYDFGGSILAGHDVKIIDCGDVAMEPGRHPQNSRRTTKATATFTSCRSTPTLTGATSVMG
jgi:agmatinase